MWSKLCAMNYTGNYGRVWALARDWKTSEGLAAFKGAFKRSSCSSLGDMPIPLTAPAQTGACVRVFLGPDRVTRCGSKVEGDSSPGNAVLRSNWVQRQTVRINNAPPIAGISSFNDLQAQVLESLKIKKPPSDGQRALLQWQV